MARESKVSATPRTWRRLLQFYHQPAAIGLLLLIVLVLWNVHEREHSRALGLREAREAAHGVSDTLAASLQAMVRRGYLERERVRIVLENIVATTDVTYLGLVVSGRVVAMAGTAPDGFVPSSTHGEELLDDEQFLHWTEIRLQDSPLPYRHRYPDFEVEPADTTLVSVADVSQSLVMAMHAHGYRQHVAEANARLDVILVGGTLCIAGLWLAWTVSVRNRELRGRLQASRLRAEHLTNLELTAQGLAHETRNPLGLVRGLAQRIAGDDDVPAAAREDAATIIEQADTASSRLGDFLAYARPRPAAPRPLDLLATIRRVCGLLTADFEDAGVQLICEGDAVVVLADRQQLEQVLVNLLLNSLQASPSGTRVSVAVMRSRDDSARVKVADQGHGVDPALEADIFKPYVTGRSDGHGLGLAIVARVVEDHGWSIALQPGTDGPGTTVVIDDLTIVSGSEAEEAQR